MHDIDALLAGVRAQVGPADRSWLDDAVQRATAGDVPQLLRAYTESSRRLGTTPLTIDAGIRAACEPGDDVVLSRWTLEDAGRLLLLNACYRGMGAAAGRAAALECYEQGSTREQQSWLRTLEHLPEPGGFLAVAIDACRTSILPLFESIACENSYPAHHFPELNFNQLVLKAVFNGVALNRIVGLGQRRNPDLSRMAGDYAAERRAAGRPVPADLSMVMLAAPGDGALTAAGGSNAQRTPTQRIQE